ncbi:protein kinase [Yinghuangia sp. KLBMP8922]|uniref:non-specific serine/threonine protein kinase n=2 Tax=Yinghuangia soli TaxID=2908204 RepID=A0AA41QAU5_9ACTN|nr:protein kinase [Yinghuangia soli]
MGEVWKAVDRELGRTVAVKVLPAELTRHDEFRTRFRREARTVAALSHQGVATLYDVGEDTGGDEPTPFLVMEFVEGRTLADVLRDGALPVARTLAIGRDIADTLVHSHGHGLVHRDIKPSNIMLTASGGVKVLDFGIAKALAETTTRLTATGMTVGTPAYLSPEQIDGRAVDGRSDLYSLGCLLYELLAGHPPFSGDSPFVVMNQHLTKVPAPPSALRPQIPAEVDALVLRLLAKTPEERHSGATELRVALEALQAALQEGQAPTEPRSPARPAHLPSIPAPASAPQDQPVASVPSAPPAPSVASLPTSVGRSTGPVAPADDAGIPAPPPSGTAAAHAATRIVPPSFQVTTAAPGPWAVKFKVTRDGLTALAGILMIPIAYFSADPDNTLELNHLAVAVVPVALLALLWSARVAAVIAWFPPAALLSTMSAFTSNIERDSGFAFPAFQSQIGWRLGSLGGDVAAGFIPVALITAIALGSFLTDREAPAWYIAVFWNFGMLLLAGSEFLSLEEAMTMGGVVLVILIAVTVTQEVRNRAAAAAAPPAL